MIILVHQKNSIIIHCSSPFRKPLKGKSKLHAGKLFPETKHEKKMHELTEE